MPNYPLLPTPSDDYQSETSINQSKTEDSILNLLLPWLRVDLIPTSFDHSSCSNETIDEDEDEVEEKPQKVGSRSIDTAILDRSAHMKYLIPSLSHLGPRLTTLDASRPWLMYWILNSFSILNLGLNPTDRQRAIDTILSFQHPHGGFGGGPGQLPHLAPTYSSISTLASLLGEAEPNVIKETWSRVNIKGMYEWMLSLKQTDGSFVMQMNGEIDVRGTYCALIVASLLNFLTPDFSKGLSDFISGCQTYEGGLASASQSIQINPLNSNSNSNSNQFIRVPLGEAHGGYTSCGLLSHCLLKSLPRSSHIKSLDYQACLRWLALMQALPIEGGGFRGRTNKLVDGCYSWWCGGLIQVIEALIEEEESVNDDQKSRSAASINALYDRKGLQEYILLISQGQDPEPIVGGLRDKPSVPPDHYHTHYILSGLSSAQNHHRISQDQSKRMSSEFDSRSKVPHFKGQDETIEESMERCKSIYSRSNSWVLLDEKGVVIGVPENRLIPIHPVFNIRPEYVKKTMDHFYLQDL
ncbi:terpenoid cyclases/protein prenyltransferase alpha-alpha toroid [Melampsora americana]|nr:terpenoid cyclases/protein prenyltransferase alpha-alpha toroid [Melampsora americana]